MTYSCHLLTFVVLFLVLLLPFNKAYTIDNTLQKIFKALKEGHSNTAKQLIEQRRPYYNNSFDGVDTNGSTLVSIATRKGYGTIIKLLFEKGADPNKQDTSRKAPLDYALEGNHKLCVEMLTKHLQTNVTPTHLFQAIKAGYTKTVENILYYLTHSYNQKNSIGGGIRAVLEPLQYRMRKHQIPNINCKNAQGQSPLEVAILLGKCDIAYLLMQSGAQLTTTTHKKYTNYLAYTAAKKNNFKVVKLLVSKGTDCNIAFQSGGIEKGTTPLHWAAYHCNKEMVQLLLQHGALPNLKNIEGSTPLHCALEKVSPKKMNHRKPPSHFFF